MEAWANGEALGQHEQTIAQCYTDIVELNYEDDVAPYYPKTKEETDD